MLNCGLDNLHFSIGKVRNVHCQQHEVCPIGQASTEDLFNNLEATVRFGF
jgi:hypothetical protein